jgi:enamine deaminase RidA (YjgF/YER057c/UK114 family)
MLRTLIVATALAAVGVTAQAAELKRQGAATAIISRAVVVPAGATTLYVSGITPRPENFGAPAGTPQVWGDTKAQAITVFKQIEEIVKAEGFSMGDMAMLRVFLVADPKKNNQMDFTGFNEAYSQFFGTADQPNKPARITMQITQLVNPALLVEIEGQAAKAP